MSKPPGSSGSTERIGQLLFVATQAAQTLATERLQPLGLSARGWGVLSTLAESGPLTQIELATALAIDRTAMVYLLDELEDSGLAERVRNPDDRRSFLIHLTGEGQRTQRQAAKALASAADTLLRPLDPEERDLLRTLLTRIADHWQALSAAQP
jgi:DNA-binding MarR family transcriptional regulator